MLFILFIILLKNIIGFKKITTDIIKNQFKKVRENMGNFEDLQQGINAEEIGEWIKYYKLPFNNLYI